jgi:hypothetical protein
VGPLDFCSRTPALRRSDPSKDDSAVVQRLRGDATFTSLQLASVDAYRKKAKNSFLAK